MSELNYAKGRLFKPLGIYNVTIWPGDPQGNNNGGGDLHLTPHDMAKLGYLYLNKGTWGGKQVVPAALVSRTTQIQGKTYVFNPNPIGLDSFSLTFEEEKREALLKMGLPEAAL